MGINTCQPLLLMSCIRLTDAPKAGMAWTRTTTDQIYPTPYDVATIPESDLLDISQKSKPRNRSRGAVRNNSVDNKIRKHKYSILFNRQNYFLPLL